MGQINLFAPNLTDTMNEFLAQYKAGQLRDVGAIRILEEKEFPHSNILCNIVPYSYVLVEVAAPLTYADIDWLYRSIISEEWVYERGVAMRYSIERCLNPPGTKNPRRKVNENSNEWELIREFRRCLEVPALALRHFKQTYRPDGMVNVEKHGHILVIEYDALPLPPRRARTS